MRPVHAGKTLRGAIAVLLLVAAAPERADAQTPGVRAGVSANPDQFYLGAHYESSELVERVHFKPNVEAGFGDNVTLIALNVEFIYKFPRRRQWDIYAGAGPGINIYSFDVRGRSGTNTEPGLNVLFGIENAKGLSFEVKVGGIDSPDVKFGIGWSFR